MTTYTFAEKNGSSSLVLLADSENEAIKYLEAIVKFPLAWRLDGEE